MTLEGTGVFAQLDAAFARAKGDLADCQSGVRQARRRDARTPGPTGRGPPEGLARHYLPEVSRTAIESTFEGIRADLLAILARREAKRDALEIQLDQGNEEIRSPQRRDRRRHPPAQREGRRPRAARGPGRRDPQGERRLPGAVEARPPGRGEAPPRREPRRRAWPRSRPRSSPHYDRSRLFRYLHDRGYGTPDYKPSGWVRSLDRRVADLIDYPNALNGYEFLKKTPELVAAEVSRRRDQFTELMKQVEAIEKVEADKVGLTAVLAEGDALGNERDRLVGEVGQLQKGRPRRSSRNSPAWSRSRTSSTARRSSDSARSSARPSSPFSRSGRGRPPSRKTTRSSPTSPRSTSRSRRSARARRDLARRRKAADRVKEGLDRVIRQYRQANYDSDRSYFEDLDLGRRDRPVRSRADRRRRTLAIDPVGPEVPPELGPRGRHQRRGVRRQPHRPGDPRRARRHRRRRHARGRLSRGPAPVRRLDLVPDLPLPRQLRRSFRAVRPRLVEFQFGFQHGGRLHER